jgi:MarR family transcriptional regulator, organic hydroperoxide resistance regulator
MTKAKSRKHLGPTGKIDAAVHGHIGGADEAFPPLTTSLKDFVKQGSDTEFRRLVYTLVSLAHQMSRHLKLFAAHIGVTEAQAVMIRIIAETNGAATVGQLAQQLYVTSPFVTKEIGGLVKKSIVQKQPNQADRRSMFLTLTPKGKVLLRELSEVMRKANDVHFRSLNKDRAALLQEIVSTLVADGAYAYYEINAPYIRESHRAAGADKSKASQGVHTTKRKTRR